MDLSELALTGVRAVVVYLFLLVLLRLLGKRAIGAATMFDFMVALILGDLVDAPIYGDAPLSQALVAVVVIAGLHYLNSYLGYRSATFDRLTGGAPRVLIRNGQVDDGAMARERLNLDELMSMLRSREVQDLEQVKLATLEPDGQLSVLKADGGTEADGGGAPTGAAR